MEYANWSNHQKKIKRKLLQLAMSPIILAELQRFLQRALGESPNLKKITWPFAVKVERLWCARFAWLVQRNRRVRELPGARGQISRRHSVCHQFESLLALGFQQFCGRPKNGSIRRNRAT